MRYCNFFEQSVNMFQMLNYPIVCNFMHDLAAYVCGILQRTTPWLCTEGGQNHLQVLQVCWQCQPRGANEQTECLQSINWGRVRSCMCLVILVIWSSKRKTYWHKQVVQNLWLDMLNPHLLLPSYYLAYYLNLWEFAIVFIGRYL